MIWDEVKPEHFDDWETDPDTGIEYPTNVLPVDEWTCSTCSTPLGFVLDDNGERPRLDWVETFVPHGNDPLVTDCTRLCFDCSDNQKGDS